MTKKDSLRCLAVQNPFAWAICAGEDTVENRSRSTDHRGTIAIHASTSKTRANGLTKGGVIPADLFTFGAIIGLVDVEDVIEYGPRVETKPWACGSICWLMTNPRFKLGELDLAIDDATQALELEPELFEALLIRSQAYEAKGDTGRAKRDEMEAAKIEAEVCNSGALR